MRTHGATRSLALPVLVFLGAAPGLVADSYVAGNRKHAWSENVGWSNWADANGRAQGVEVYQNGSVQYLKGWVWFENIGWMHVGDGNAPYLNTTGGDYGVNIDPGTGDMTGLAWAESSGWINFGPFVGGSTAAPARWDHANFRTGGWAWGESIGWINLNDAIHYVCAMPGDFDFNGTVDVFDFGTFALHFGSSGNAAFTLGDCDGDGDTDVFDFGIFALNFGDEC